MSRIVAMLLWVCLSQTVAHAENTKDFQRMSEVTWAAFECAAFAGASGNLAEKNRLFDRGYTEGTRFLEEWRASKVDEQQVFKLNWELGSRLSRDVSPDFVLGMVWEAATAQLLASIDHEIGTPGWKAAAAASYSKGNCALI